jgi:hypothetical protein
MVFLRRYVIFQWNVGKLKIWGSKWTSSLHFYDYDDPEPKMSKLNRLDVAIFKFPQQRQNIVEIFRMIHPLTPFQITWGLFHHAYIFVRTEETEQWSFEKNQEAILVQHETNPKYCLKHLYGNCRSCIYTIEWNKKWVNSGVSVQDVFDWTISTDEVFKPYHLLEDNCQDFATRITDAIISFDWSKKARLMLTWIHELFNCNFRHESK